MQAFKLRSILVWIGLIFTAASFLLGIVWKQNTYVQLSRRLIAGERDYAQLNNALLILETEVSELKNPSRLEKMAMERFGLIHSISPILVQPDGQILAKQNSRSETSPLSIHTASWLEGFAWRIKGW